MPTAYPQAIFSAVLEAIGEIDAHIGGVVYTFLAAQLEPTDTTIQVDGTIDMETSGTIRIGAEDIDYVSKTATTLVATTRSPSAIVHPPGTLVYDRTALFSEVDSARSQMHFGRASGAALRDLLDNFSLPAPGGFADAQLRAFGRYCAHVPAGPITVIAGALDAVLSGPLLYGSITGPAELTLDALLTWPTMARRLVRILSPDAAAGVYRIRGISGLIATLEPAGGAWWKPAAGLVNGPATWECVPFDVWQHPQEPGIFRVDVLRFDSLIALAGSAYLNGGELRTSTTALSITTAHPINNVLGVYLAGDVERSGTNYYTGGSFLGSVITLVVPLPSATEPVIVDYGSIASSAQLLMGAAINGTNYYPFYLSDPGSYVTPILEIVRAHGFLPLQSLIAV